MVKQSFEKAYHLDGAGNPEKAQHEIQKRDCVKINGTEAKLTKDAQQ